VICFVDQSNDNDETTTQTTTMRGDIHLRDCPLMNDIHRENDLKDDSPCFIMPTETSTFLSSKDRSPRHQQHRTYLSSEYQLNEYDVICGRGTTCYYHIGNVRFRQLVQQHLTSYMNTTNKYDKTAVLQHIINEIRQRTPTVGGGVVKKDKCVHRYYEVGDFLAVCIHLFVIVRFVTGY
jgi:hypothetical protein